MKLIFLPFEFLFVQLLFRLFGWLVKAAVKAFVYSPQLVSAYFICKPFMPDHASTQAWVLAIVSVALLLYGCVLLLKTILLSLKDSSNPLWIPLFLFLVSYTCILPIWIGFDTLKQLMHFLSPDHSTVLTWLSCALLSGYIYRHYNFLNP